jgi:hypothetical protein
VLALDGGGARGVVSLAFLARLEAALRARHGRPDLRLAEYFDLIGGTSTGAIIAAGLALGRSVAEIDAAYTAMGPRVFGVPWWRALRLAWLAPKHPSAPLERALRDLLGETTLGDPAVRTGLAIVIKRLDTGSLWVVHNNPRGRYFAPPADDPGAAANRDLPLWKLVRASAAAPFFFRPERIEIARGLSGLFVDGGVTPHNNPALLMFLLAALDGYGFRWRLGADDLLLVSVGTGVRPWRRDPGALESGGLVRVALESLLSLRQDCVQQAETMLQWLGRSPTRRIIDGEIGLAEGPVPGGAPLLTYLRYELDLDAATLGPLVGEALDDAALAPLEKMDRWDIVPRLSSLAGRAADRLVAAAHLPAAFDLAPAPGQAPAEAARP